jgi:hypothetical protein
MALNAKIQLKPQAGRQSIGNANFARIIGEDQSKVWEECQFGWREESEI